MAENYDRYVPDHLQENYRQLVADRHDGDWKKLARALDASGESKLAKWAAAQADDAGDDSADEPENAMAKTETTKRGPGRPRKDAQ